MEINKEKADTFFAGIIAMVLIVLLLPAVIGFYLGSVVYYFFPYKLAVGLFFAGFTLLLILMAAASGSGYLVLSIIVTIFLAGSFLFFPQSEITLSSMDMMEETRREIQQAAAESEGSLSILWDQAKEIPPRMVNGFTENLKEIKRSSP